MGGTDPSNFLNTIGKNKDGTGNGDILIWKRKAEKYLIKVGLHLQKTISFFRNISNFSTLIFLSV